MMILIILVILLFVAPEILGFLGILASFFGG